MTLWTPPGADLGELDAPTPDPISMRFYAGLDENGHPVPMTYRNLLMQAAQMPVTVATPDGPAELLKTSRDMYVLGLYSYNLVASSCTWALAAVEAALKLRLNKGKNATFQKMIQEADALGLVPPGAEDILETGREVRNFFVHEGKASVLPFAVAVNVIRTSHVLVAELYP